jgi:glycosyltransferase involved in cell wall biosynthesis
MLKISIVTVVFNNCDTIERAITSVLGQNYKDVEYIVVDGGSTDGTLEILGKYADRISRIISEEDNGIYDAMNKGIKVATGDIVAILNSDDSYFDNTILSEVAKTFIRYNTDTVFADVILVKQHKQESIVRYYRSNNFKVWHLRFGHMPPHATFFAKRQIFQKHGFYNTNYKISADFDLILRFLYIHKVSSKYIPRIFVRMSMGGISTQGFSSIIKMNKELLKSLTINKVRSNFLMIYMKYLVKVFQYILRPR